MNDFVFSSSFNLANMTCQLVELGSINPLKPISTSWNIEIAKLKLLSLRLGCFLASLQYPTKQAIFFQRYLSSLFCHVLFLCYAKSYQFLSFFLKIATSFQKSQTFNNYHVRILIYLSLVA